MKELNEPVDYNTEDPGSSRLKEITSTVVGN